MRRAFLKAAAAAALAASPLVRARAQAAEIRIGVQPGMSYLPFYVMEHERLLEKRLDAAGLPGRISWRRFANGPAMNDGLLSGALDIVATGVPAFLTIWAKARGSSQVRGLAAYGSVPTMLVTSNPKVLRVADFTDSDRIAVPAVKASLQAILLEMAAEKAFGPGNWARLDPLTISRAHPDAMAALLAPRSEVTAHFSASPYYLLELRDPRIHVVTTAEQITGQPTSNGMLYFKETFYAANRAATRQFISALTDAFELINRNPSGAAVMYADLSGDKTPVAEIVSIIKGPGSSYEATPRGIKNLADFMKQIGLLDRGIGAWSDLFVDEIHDLPGS